ncbi:alpha/beta hydrolase [Serratia sp. IR-2025]|uniref:alpha/beta hydrolase n=1 Tax=Serratia marcescens TaxID=615 RepID=UPI003879AAB6
MDDIQVIPVVVPFMDEALTLHTYSLVGGAEVYPAPTVVLCHGFCGVQRLLLPAIARYFAQNGYVVITFDYRGFGESSGERGRLTLARQQEDILTVLHWIEKNPILDETRIGLWGTSLGGVNAVCVAAHNPLVKCVISQMPFADGFTLLTADMDEGEIHSFIASLEAMDERRRVVGKELWLSPMRILKDRDSQAFFKKHKQDFPEIDTKIPFLTTKEMLYARPIFFAGKVTQPTLVTLAECDVVNPLAQGKQLFDALAGRKMLHVIAGAGHYQLYEPPFLEQALVVQHEWLRKHL